MNTVIENNFPSEKEFCDLLKDLNLKTELCPKKKSKKNKDTIEESSSESCKIVICKNCGNYAYKLKSNNGLTHNFQCSGTCKRSKFNERRETFFKNLQMKIREAMAIIFLNSLNNKNKKNKDFTAVYISNLIHVSIKSVGKFIQKINFINDYESLSADEIESKRKKFRFKTLDIDYNKKLIRKIIKYCKENEKIKILRKILTESHFSFLPYIGSKAKLVKPLSSMFPKNFGNYCEPFCGGGSMFFAIKTLGLIEEKNDRKFYISDSNPELINLYNHLRDNYEQLFEGLQEYAKSFNDLKGKKKVAFWNDTKRKYNEASLTALKRATIFWFLSKTSFRGTYTFDKNGKFEGSCNAKGTCGTRDSHRYERCSKMLQENNVTVKNHSFEDIEPFLKAGDFAYMDSPYIKQKNGTIDYGSYLATPEGQKKIRDFALRLHEKGVYFMLSNYKNSYIEELYSDKEIFNIQTIKVNRGIAGENRKEAEVLIRNYKQIDTE